jgi:hypothetical protein
VKVVAVRVAEAIGSLNVALNAEPMDTFVAPLAGTVERTEGGGGGAVTVVNVHT